MEILNMVTKLPWHDKRIWSSRDVEKAVNKIIIHQELGDAPVEIVNKYHITPGPNNHLSPRGAPHFAYHYAIRRGDKHGPDGQIVQVNELTHVTWHTFGENGSGVGIMLEGNYKGIGHIHGHKNPTIKQMESLERLVKYLLDNLSLKSQDVWGHYHFGKPACPGYHVSEWIEEFRNRKEISSNAQLEKLSIKDIQDMLDQLGYYLGESGADGLFGINTTSAVRKFQTDNGLLVDGIPGPQTRAHLILKLKGTKNEKYI